MAAQPEQEAPLDVVIMAGSINRIPLYPGNQPGRKALVTMHGRPMISYVLDALQQSRCVGRILVVGAPEVREFAARWPRVEGVPDGHSLVRNAHRGLVAARTERVLFCHPDQPLLEGRMIDDFVERALPVDADVVTSWVKYDALGRYTEEEHKFFGFGDGKYAHGNLLLFKRDFPNRDKLRGRLEQMYRGRKNLLKFAWALGPTLFLKFAKYAIRRKMPTLAEALAACGEEFEVKLASVLCPYPEIVMDVDEPEDYATLERYLSLPKQEPARIYAT